MREILFRGKRTDGKWEIGYYFAKPILEKHFIIYDNNQWLVTPETVGQFTGLTDKNGEKIFEGDILQSVYSKKNYPVFYGEYTCIDEFGEEEDACGWYNDEFDCGYKLTIGRTEDWAVVIGNIHDNPELLEVTSNETD